MSTDSTPEWLRWIDVWVLPYVEDGRLNRVAFALLAHLVVAIVPLMLAVYRAPGPITTLVLLAFVAATAGLVFVEHRSRGRVGGMAIAVVLTWVSSIGLAVLCEQTGLL